MKLEDQVVSLNLAKRLKELGVNQFGKNAYFAWYIDEVDGTNSLSRNMPGARRKNQNSFSAFTVAELLNLLDEEITIPKVENVADYIAEKLCSKLTQK